MKRILLFFGALLLGAGAIMMFALSRHKVDDWPDVLVTNFAAYDLARAAAGDDVRIEMLLKPGAELHDYEPTAEDLVKIRHASLLIYNGGESEAWMDEILSKSLVYGQVRTFGLMQVVELKEEETVEGMESEEGEDEAEAEYDEHVWTSPRNMIAMLDVTAEQMRSAGIAVDEAKLADYREKLVAVDNELRDVADGSAHKELIFGDRFPFRYFVDEFGLKYYAAFPGCADKTEANSATVAFLIQKVREDEVPVILKTELSAGVVAEAIARETGAKVMEFHSAHNISREDFEAGVTYVDLMRRNLAVLREALR